MIREKNIHKFHTATKKKERPRNPPSMREIRRFLNSNTLRSVHFQRNNPFERDVWLPPVNNRTEICYYSVGKQQERSSTTHQPVSSSLTVPLPVRSLAPYAHSQPSAVAPPPPPYFCSYTLPKPPSSNPSGSQHTTTTHTHTLTPS